MNDSPEQFDRIPPADIAAEMCYLSALMTCADPVAFAEMRNVATADDFFSLDHRAVFSALIRLHDENKTHDAAMLLQELRRVGKLEEVGGFDYIRQLVEALPVGAHGACYGRVVVDCSRRRDLISIANELAAEAYRPRIDRPTADLAQAMIQRLARAASGTAAEKIAPLADVIHDVYEQLDRRESQLIPFGFIDLDAELGGMASADVWLLAARPSMGKSTLMRNIARRLADVGIPVGILALEERKEKIARNLLSNEATIENSRLRSSTDFNPVEWESLARGVGKLAGLPIWLYDSSRRLADIRAAATLMVARNGCRLLCLDHLGLIGGTQGKTEYERVSAASMAVSEIGKETGAAILCLCQLNRAVEHRDEKRPTMGDLRDSGQIEQNADGILLLYRDTYYNPSGKRGAEIIVAKARDGVRGKIIELGTDLRYQRFTDKADPFASSPYGDEP